MKNYRNGGSPVGFVQFIIHTDDFFVHFNEDFLEISPQYRGTTLALFDVVIRKEY